jgi:FkbM family methyltransferase
MRQQLRDFVQDAFPRTWLRWYFRRNCQLIEAEVALLDRIVPSNRVSVDVGANLGLYTRRLARLSRHVIAFEPAQKTAAILKRTLPRNVVVHEIALSDRSGVASLRMPYDGETVAHGLASIEPLAANRENAVKSLTVPVRRLDAVVRSDVGFVKIDVEGHELNVLNGAKSIVERCQPVFLVEAENRHRADATQSVFDFFRARRYSGFFITGDAVLGIDEFDAGRLQDPDALLPDGGRKQDRYYINNFFFFPQALDGRKALAGAR